MYFIKRFKKKKISFTEIIYRFFKCCCETLNGRELPFMAFIAYVSCTSLYKPPLKWGQNFDIHSSDCFVVKASNNDAFTS